MRSDRRGKCGSKGFLTFIYTMFCDGRMSLMGTDDLFRRLSHAIKSRSWIETHRSCHRVSFQVIGVMINYNDGTDEHVTVSRAIKHGVINIPRSSSVSNGDNSTRGRFSMATFSCDSENFHSFIYSFFLSFVPSFTNLIDNTENKCETFPNKRNATQSCKWKPTRPRRRRMRPKKLFLRITKLNISFRKHKQLRREARVRENVYKKKMNEWILPVNKVNGKQASEWTKRKKKWKKIQMNWIYCRFVLH